MKWTVITGASSGIGKELAHIYANKGHHLILIARRIEILEEMKEFLESKYDVLVTCISFDLSRMEEINVLTDQLNTYEIEILINNAGIGLFQNTGELAVDDLIIQNNINYNAPVLLCEHLLANIKRNKGSVINLCSILSYLPNRKASVYCATKSALYSYSNVLRIEHKDIHVLTVHPITVKTSFFKEPSYLENNKKALTPNKVATLIYKAQQKRKRILNIPKSIKWLNVMYLLFPKTIDFLNNKFYSNK